MSYLAHLEKLYDNRNKVSLTAICSAHGPFRVILEGTMKYGILTCETTAALCPRCP